MIKKIDVTAAEMYAITRAFASDEPGTLMPGYYHVNGMFDVDIVMRVSSNGSVSFSNPSIQKVVTEVVPLK